jgi:hypothetical protein
VEAGEQTLKPLELRDLAWYVVEICGYDERLIQVLVA